MMNIRRATPEDVSAIIECDDYAKTDQSRSAKIGEAIARSDCLVAIENESVTGYCTFNDHFFNHRFVELVVVAATSRRRGAARALLRAAFDACPTDRIFSSTNASNVAAQALLAICGFYSVGRIRGLDDDDPEVFFSRRIVDSRATVPARSGLRIVGPNSSYSTACEAVLRSLPDWFGIESALTAYARNTSRFPTFVVLENDSVVGFVSLQKHFDTSWEIACAAVQNDARHRGIGTTLFDHAESWLSAQGATVLQVKTLAATSPNPFYAETRAFYERRGFVSLEILDAFWSSENPCLMMVKTLRNP